MSRAAGPTRAAGTGRAGALLAAAALLAGFVVAAALLTPWDLVAGQSVAADPALDFTAAERATEDAYRGALAGWAYGGLVVSLLVAVALGVTPVGARVVSALGGLGRRSRVVAAVVVLSALPTLAALPLRIGAERVRREEGLSVRGWDTFALDALRGLGVEVAVLVPAVAVVLWLARRAPRGWWVPAAAAAAGLVVVGSFLYPVVVEPLYSRTTPLAAGPLREDLRELVERSGVDVAEIVVSDASRRTTTLNAHVSGFGPSRRLVVQDTLLAQDPAEVRLVVAHELGHVRADDVLRGTLLGALGVAGAAVLGYLLLTWPWLLARAGATSAADLRAVPLMLAVVALLGLAASPVQNLVSRQVEARADVAALELTDDPQLFVDAFRTLATENRSDLDPPLPLYLMFASHPTAPERIALARQWARANGLPVPAPAAPAVPR